MLPELKYLQENWIDGMKIAEDHLHQLNSSTQDLTRDAIAISLNNYNYGLVNPVSESEKAYPSEWSDVNACQFESVLMDVIRTEYNRLDISESLAPASRMLSMFHVLFGKLSLLDFIGKRKGEGSFVRERIIESETNKKDDEKPKSKGWSFLAD